MIRIRDTKNFGCAALFVGLAAVLAVSALRLPVGTVSEMGPGYFPLALAMILGALGLILAAQSLRVDGPPVATFEWRGFVRVLLALVAFGATITRLGFVPAVILAAGIAVSASSEIRLRTAILLTMALLLFCWAVFVRGLGLPVRLFGA